MPKDTGQEQQIEVQDKTPQTTRESIRAAIDEVKEKESQEESREKPVVSQTADPSIKGKEAAEPTEIKEVKQVEQKESEQLELDLGDKKTDKKAEVKDERESIKEPKAPFGTPKELRAKWTTLDQDTQGYVSKLLKENLDLKSESGRKSHLRDVDTVLQPYMPELQKLKVSPAVLVKRLLEYSDALAAPQYKYAAIARLAQDFNIDLGVFGPQQQQTQQNTQQNKQQTQQQTEQTQQEYYIPPEVDQKLDTILDKFGQLENNQRSASDVSAKNYVDSWSGFNQNTNEYTKRPYFPYVRQAMHQLIANGTIPVENGTVDLDKAYETACFLNQEVRERISEDYNRDKAQIAEQKKQQQIKAAQKAKFTGSSIRSGAPLPNRSGDNIKSNSGKQPVSIRDSIRAALQEHGTQ